MVESLGRSCYVILRRRVRTQTKVLDGLRLHPPHPSVPLLLLHLQIEKPGAPASVWGGTHSGGLDERRHSWAAVANCSARPTEDMRGYWSADATA